MVTGIHLTVVAIVLLSLCAEKIAADRLRWQVEVEATR
jgi:hypothetical protein